MPSSAAAARKLPSRPTASKAARRCSCATLRTSERTGPPISAHPNWWLDQASQRASVGARRRTPTVRLMELSCTRLTPALGASTQLPLEPGEISDEVADLVHAALIEHSVLVLPRAGLDPGRMV